MSTMHDYDRRTAATYPTFFLRAFQRAAKESTSKLVAEVMELVEVDSEDEDPNREQRTYNEVLAELGKHGADVLEAYDLKAELEPELEKILDAVAVGGSTAPSVENLRVEFKGGGNMKLRFTLWYGEAEDIDNPDEAANAPDADALLTKALGAGCRAYFDEIRRTDWGGNMFIFSATCEKRGMALADLFAKVLGNEIKKAIAKAYSV